MEAEITIHDVAKHAGVSPTTVSRVMRNNSNVKTDTRDKVLESAKALQYKKETYNTNTKAKQKSVIIIIPSLQDPFFINALKGIMDQAGIFKYQTVLYDSNDSGAKDHSIIKEIDASTAEGIIIVPSGSTDATLNLLENQKKPFVFLDRVPKEGDFSSVTSDDYDGAFQGTKQLITLGHKKIIYVGGNNELSTEQNRLNGYINAMKSSGLKINENRIFECGFNFESAFTKTTEFLKTDIEFSAAFAANDLIALGMKHAFNQEGLSIPKDVSIIGYGDMPVSRYLSLTTVSSPSYEMGKNAFSILNAMIEGRITENESVVLRPSLILRGSCKAL